MKFALPRRSRAARATGFAAVKWKGSKRRSPNELARLLMIPILLAYGGLLVWALWFWSPVMVSVAAVHTEQVSFVVMDRQKAAFHVDGMVIGPRGSDQAGCESGLFTPGLGAKVEYGRVGEGPLAIDVTPAEKGAVAGLLDRGDGGPSVPYPFPVVMQQDPKCPGYAMFKSAPLPIWGDAQIGEEFHPAVAGDLPEPTMLLDGKVEAFAHAFRSNLLYNVSALSLPVASRLSTANSADNRAIWWGVASADHGATALTVHVSTEAPRLALYRPYQTNVDIISLSTTTQLFNDPTIRFMHACMAVLIAGVLVSEWMAKHLHDRRR